MAGEMKRQQSLERSYVVIGQPGQGKASPECNFAGFNRLGKDLRYPAQSALSFQSTQQAVPHGVGVLVEELAAYPGNHMMLQSVVLEVLIFRIISSGLRHLFYQLGYDGAKPLPARTIK